MSSNKERQTINFSKEIHRTVIDKKNVFIVPTRHGSNADYPEVQICDTVDHCWLDRYYTGSEFNVHFSGEYISYGIKTNSTHFVKIVSLKTGLKTSIHVLNGPVKDIKFAFISSPIIVAVLDSAGNVFVYKIIQNKVFSYMLDVELYLQIIKNSGASCTIAWCPFILEYAEEVDYDFSRVLAVTCEKKVELWNIDVAQRTDCSEFVTIKNKTEITQVICTVNGQVLAVVSADGVVRFYQFDARIGDHSKPLHEWIPHNGKEITMLHFLDSKTNGLQMWKYAITGCNNNTEIKIWSCVSWSVLNSIHFSQKSKYHKVLQPHLNTDNLFFFLYNPTSHFVYVFRLLDKDNNLLIHHVAEFLFPVAVTNYIVTKITEVPSSLSGSDYTINFLIIYQNYVRHCVVKYNMENENAAFTIQNIPSSLSIDSGSASNEDQLLNPPSASTVINKNDFDCLFLRPDMKNVNVIRKENSTSTTQEKSTTSTNKSDNGDFDLICDETTKCCPDLCQREAKYDDSNSKKVIKQENKNALIIDELIKNAFVQTNEVKSFLVNHNQSLILMRSLLSEGYSNIKKYNENNELNMLQIFLHDAEMLPTIIGDHLNITTKVGFADRLSYTLNDVVPDSTDEDYRWLHNFDELDVAIQQWTKTSRQLTESVKFNDVQRTSEVITDSFDKTLQPLLNNSFKQICNETVFSFYRAYMIDFLGNMQFVFSINTLKAMQAFEKYYENLKNSKNTNDLIENVSKAVHVVAEEIQKTTEAISRVQPALTEMQDKTRTRTINELIIQLINVNQTLKSDDRVLLTNLCEESDVETILSIPSLLDQKVLLTILENLCNELSLQTELKLSYMEKVIIQLDPENATADGHSFLMSTTNARNKLSKFILENVLSSDHLTRFKMLIMALDSLNISGRM